VPPLRVLTLLDTAQRVGGAEAMALEICGGLDPERFQSYLCLSRWDPGLEHEEAFEGPLQEVRESGIPILGLGRRSTASVGAWRTLVRFLRKERIDVVHSHMFGSNAWGSVTARLAGTPVMVAHEHMWSFEGAPLRRTIDRVVIGRLADSFIAVSEDARQRMIHLVGLPKEKVVVIRNGINELPQVDRRAAREQLGIPSDRLVVASVGLLRPEKAFEVLLRATAIAKEGVPELVTVIAGEGPERPQLEALARELGIDQQLRLLGYHDDIPAVLAASDICVCCSDYEGGPLSVMEYMAAGKAVVSTNAGGLPELVESDVTGLLVNARDPEGLAAAMERLLTDQSLRDRLGEEGRARATTQLSFGRTLSDVEALYLRLLKQEGPAAARA
jgi:glycosyltransferase involved in cell wall biosynthesis